MCTSLLDIALGDFELTWNIHMYTLCHIDRSVHHFSKCKYFPMFSQKFCDSHQENKHMRGRWSGNRQIVLQD